MRLTKKDWQDVTNFIYECGFLNRTPRSGLWFLGTGEQSVSEHSWRTVLIGYSLARLTPKADLKKVVMMCLFHDLGESRTSDLSYVHQKYGNLSEREAITDIAKELPFGKEILGYYQELRERKTLEAKLTKDADTLEWIAILRDEEEKGNSKTKSWIKIARQRLQTKAGKKIGELLAKTNPDSWWFDERDKWFIDRKQKYRKWRKRK